MGLFYCVCKCPSLFLNTLASTCFFPVKNQYGTIVYIFLSFLLMLITVSFFKFLYFCVNGVKLILSILSYYFR